VDWCRLSTGYYLDPALLRAGEAAEVLFLRCLAYSGAQERRGVIPRNVLPMLTPTRTKGRVDALVREGLLVEQGGHELLIRSWERWQESLDGESVRRRKAREKKARQRQEAREAEDSPADGTDTSPGTVPGTEGGQSRGRPRRIEVEVEEEQETTSLVARGRARATGPPAEFPITAGMKAWGAEHARSVEDPLAETEKFLDHARANGKTFRDWTAAWRTWMANAQTYATRSPSRLRPVPPPSRDPYEATMTDEYS